MIRRRLFAYTSLFIAGIVAGYIICEKTKIVYGTLLLIFIAIIIKNINLECKENIKEKRVLLSLLLLGCFSLMVKYTLFNMPLYGEDRNKIDVSSVTCIEGKVISINAIDDGLQLVIRPSNQAFGKKVLVNAYTDNIDKYSSYISRTFSFSGKLKKPSQSANPMCFDYSLYLKSRNINYCFTANSFTEVDSTLNLIDKLRIYLMGKRECFQSMFDGDSQALVKGMIFGDKNDLAEDIRNEFNENGTGHILAVSGLHVGFLFSVLSYFTKKRRTRLMSLVIVFIIIMYGEMTQWSPSTLRAILVVSISIMSIHLKRPFDILTSVSAAALVIVACNPYALFGTGFQMSFIAMLGIAFLSKPLSYFVGDYWSMLIAVQLSVAPYTAFTFNRINPLSIFINIPIVAISSILVPVCIITIAVVSVLGFAPCILIETINYGCKFLIRINEILNANGSWSFNVCSINIGILIGLYLLLFLISSEWTRVKLIRCLYTPIIHACIRIVVIMSMLIICFWNPYRFDEIIFVNVGQGDCTHIKTNKCNVLIDGGGQSGIDDDYSVGEKVLMPYLLKSGVNRIDYALVTHLHNDHYKGIKELNEVFRVESIGVQKEFYDSNVLPYNTSNFNINDIFSLGNDCSITAIWPIANGKRVAIDNSNEMNTVYLVKYKGIKVLITGDILEEDEIKMVNYYKNTDILDCDILKVAHHGSKSSSSNELLDAANPTIAVISVGLNNMYGHPHLQTIERLQERNIKIYRTDINGAVGINIRKGTISSVDTMR